jgi:DNA-binding protein YbaB
MNNSIDQLTELVRAKQASITHSVTSADDFCTIKINGFMQVTAVEIADAGLSEAQLVSIQNTINACFRETSEIVAKAIQTVTTG